MPASNLVIVESPAKAKTIQKILGNDYVVMPCQGHVCELVDDKYSAEKLKDYHPRYEIIEERASLVASLRQAAKKASLIWLASDEDREGEAIAWHLKEVLGLKDEQTKRIAFHEITPSAIHNAIANPRMLDMNLVNAQQARRILDRIVGYELSPVLWRKVGPRLSAGRVQSVTVRLIVEREHEIQQFKPEPFYRVTADFITPEGKTFSAALRRRLTTEQEVLDLLEAMRTTTFTIESIEKVPVRRSPAPPFTTSTLQQEAARHFGFSVSTTMRLAQSLYESGQITYMRTDSVNLSSLALNTAKQAILDKNGEKYYQFRQYATKSKGAQEAHEAIRPTYVSNPSIKGTAQEQRLYSLIWKRTIASQMADAELEKTVVTISVDGTQEQFVATGEVVVFDGFRTVYMDHVEGDENSQETLLPKLNEHQQLSLISSAAQEKFTQHPSRYTEATLVRALEELGIGRPSTYAPTITTIQKRGYVQKATRPGKERKCIWLTLKNGALKEEEKTEKYGYEKDKIIPTDVGIVVNEYLQENFQDIMDYGFTADVEKRFDDIAEGKEQWQDMLQHFYVDFHSTVDNALNYSAKASGERLLGYDPVTNAKVFAKLGKYGPMVQIGENYADEKPRYARLRPNQFIETITLDEAMDLFKLPRTVGEWNGLDVTVGAGRFGPYIRYDNAFVSIPKDEDPTAITLERCIQVIEEKRKKDADRAPRLIGHYNGKEILAASGRYGPYLKYDGKNVTLGKGLDISTLTEEMAIDFLQNSQSKNVIRSFEENENVKVLNGRYGAYITNGTDNFKIPKGTMPENLSYQDCLNIIENTAPTSKKRAVRKKS